MENTDQFTRVWQRVQGAPTPSPVQGMPEWIAREREDAMLYLHLSRQFRGRDSHLLYQMYEQEQIHAACLKGIYKLSNQTLPEVRIGPMPQESPELLLRKCYGREMRCLAAYEARSGHPEYGTVFAKMAQQEQEHCRSILEILGRLGST